MSSALSPRLDSEIGRLRHVITHRPGRELDRLTPSNMQALLFETEPTDPTTYLAVAAVLSLVAVAACLVPAFRAARIDPVLAMRAE